MFAELIRVNQLDPPDPWSIAPQMDNKMLLGGNKSE